MSPLALRGPRIREMSERQIRCVLARNHVGRVAFQGDGRVELYPVHYVYADQALYGRTSSGTKYLSWLARPEVVFEMDETSGLFDWRSVIVRGRISTLRPRGPRAEPFGYWNAVAAIRSLLPTAFTELDPMPQRFVVFRIQPTEITGREAITR
jgi:nitroimidazol reductase NimA-like FMN-containing flavoprotein (pyridoxamine 5'-phosphate oxidase superfamily)